jgi:hypothetical protein
MNLLHCRFNVDGAIKTVSIAMCYVLFFETEQIHQPPSLSALQSQKSIVRGGCKNCLPRTE